MTKTMFFSMRVTPADRAAILDLAHAMQSTPSDAIRALIHKARQSIQPTETQTAPSGKEAVSTTRVSSEKAVSDDPKQL